MVLLGPTGGLGRAYTPASMAATTMTMFDLSPSVATRTSKSTSSCRSTSTTSRSFAQLKNSHHQRF